MISAVSRRQLPVVTVVDAPLPAAPADTYTRVRSSAKAYPLALGPHDTTTILAAFAGVRAAFPWVPSEIVMCEPWGATIMREVFDGAAYQLSIRVPKSEDKTKHALVDTLNAELGETHLRAMDSGEVINVGHRDISKEAAAHAYARELGTTALRIAKFGDRAGFHGNDTHLFDRMSFNVGPDEAVHPEVDNTHLGTHARGVAATVERLLAEGSADGFMFDFDGTLTNPGTPGIAPESVTLLAELIRRGESVCVCTGRGASIIDACVKPLVEAGVPIDAICKSMKIMLFNGACSVRTAYLRAHFGPKA